MTPEARLAWIRRAAIVTAGLMFAVAALSAFVRIAPESAAAATARGAHRVAASTVLPVIIALLVLALGPKPPLQRAGRYGVALLLLAVFLAVLGRWSAGAAPPPVVLGNLLGGFLMFALSVRLAWPAAASPAVPAAAIWATALVIAVLPFSLHILDPAWPVPLLLGLNLLAMLLFTALFRWGHCSKRLFSNDPKSRF